jgi:hypothetical protein
MFAVFEVHGQAQKQEKGKTWQQACDAVITVKGFYNRFNRFDAGGKCVLMQITQS